MKKKNYSYSQKKAYWQGVGFAMANGHTLREQDSYCKNMKKNKTFDSFVKGFNSRQGR